MSPRAFIIGFVTGTLLLALFGVDVRAGLVVTAVLIFVLGLAAMWVVRGLRE